MSISRDQENPNEIQKSIAIKESKLKKILSVVKESASEPVNLVFIFSYLFTAIAEMLGRTYSIKWYSLMLIITAIYVVDKFYLWRRATYKSAQSE